jgi:GlpG protein
MRKIGTIPDEQDARRFRDYLLTLGIKSEVNPDNNHAQVVWVLEEDQLERARSELAEFLQTPRAEKYAGAVEAAQRQRDAEVKEALAARKQQVNLRERWERPLVAQLPVTMLLIALSVGATAWSEFMKNGSATNLLFIQSILPDGVHYVRRLPDVMHGQVWRLITPVFLHGNWLHIVMNMYMLFVLGGSVESAKGPWKYAGLVLFMGAASNIAQYVDSGPSFGGMSGVDFGLFGYLWMKSRYAPEEGFYMPQHVVVQAMIWMGLCIFGFIPHIANAAHTVGLVAGMLVALGPVVYRHLMR